MPLKIRVKPGQTFTVNGVRVRNDGARAIALVVLDEHAEVLREGYTGPVKPTGRGDSTG